MAARVRSRDLEDRERRVVHSHGCAPERRERRWVAGIPEPDVGTAGLRVRPPGGDRGSQGLQSDRES
jgi:hypothetical protein